MFMAVPCGFDQCASCRQAAGLSQEARKNGREGIGVPTNHMTGSQVTKPTASVHVMLTAPHFPEIEAELLQASLPGEPEGLGDVERQTPAAG